MLYSVQKRKTCWKLSGKNQRSPSSTEEGTEKANYSETFRQFLLRGNNKVTTEILLLAMAYDINKLHSKIQNDRTGTQLIIKDSA